MKILSESRDPIFISRDPIWVPKTLKKPDLDPYFGESPG